LALTEHRATVRHPKEFQMKPILTALALTLAATTAQADCRFTLNFAHGSAALSVADAMLLTDLARAYPEGPVMLSAHADEDGSRAENDRVAQARAQAVMARMEGSGLHRGAVVQSLALGADWDVIPTAASSPLNRRVELFVGGCDPRAHVEARPMNAPGAMFRADGKLRMTSPRLPKAEG
jgi:outer membrane protein OmpA-like peptidoglycan-associated protein